MAWTIHPIDSSGQLGDMIEPVSAAIERARLRIETVVPAFTLDVVLQAWPDRIDERFGFTGYAPTADMIQLTIDPANPNLRGHLGEPFERMVAHEVHHAVRWAGPGYGRTLGEALVSEGLAGRFAQQLYGNEPEHYECALEAGRLMELASVAAERWDEADYDHPRWFFGTSDLPVHAGYTLGFALAGTRLKARPHESAAGLAHEDAAGFRPFLRALEDDHDATANGA